MNKAAHKMGATLRPMYDDQELDAYFASFPPKKRELYREAYKTPVCYRKDGSVTAFIKCENVPYKTKDKPRVIQFRQPAFLAHMAPWYKPIEHRILKDGFCWNKYQKRTSAKGLNNLERMEILEDMVSSLLDPYAIALDGRSWDAHITGGALKAEWRFYIKMAYFAGYPSWVLRAMRKCMKVQLKNRCRFRVDDATGRYKVNANRMSGDLNTGCGNTVLQSGYIAAAMKNLNVPQNHWRMLVDGDDAVLLVSGRYLPNLDNLDKEMARYSQDCEIGTPTPVALDNMEGIDFCQSRPVRVDGKWRLVRNPKKVYNGYHMVNTYYRSQEETERFMATVAAPEMIFARGVPILRNLFTCLHRLAGNAKPLDAVARRFWLRQCGNLEGAIPEAEISWETRLSFEKAFGWSPSEQLFMEDEFDAWDRSHLLEACSKGWQPSTSGPNDTGE